MSANLSIEYARQERWRPWDEAIAHLPLQPGERVLDLGCGVGAVSPRLHHAGADVIGIDSDAALLQRAREDHPGLRFESLDLQALTAESLGLAGGIWSSFVAAYFPDLVPVLSKWRACLRPGGWLALVEVDDLLAHQPMPARFSDRLPGFYDEARAAGRYDFLSGRSLSKAARDAGFDLVSEHVLPDAELSFTGAAAADVLTAWRMRLSRMGGLKNHLGAEFPAFEKAFLDALASPEHRSRARVVMVLARSR